jgi:hypothetical protein
LITLHISNNLNRAGRYIPAFFLMPQNPFGEKMMQLHEVAGYHGRLLLLLLLTFCAMGCLLDPVFIIAGWLPLAVLKYFVVTRLARWANKVWNVEYEAESEILAAMEMYIGRVKIKTAAMFGFCCAVGVLLLFNYVLTK